MLICKERTKTEAAGEKPLGAREININKLNPPPPPTYIASTRGFEPWPHWWEGGERSHHKAILAARPF